MALQVWLPLQGDLKNQGLTNITLNSGSPTYTNGKLGQCLNTGTLLFTAENDLIVSLGETNIYSMCCWCKNLSTSASSRWVFYIGGDASGLMRGLWENNSTTTRHWAYSGSGVNIATSINTIDGQWHHLCFTSNGATVKLYVDGIYQSQITNGKTDALAANHIYLNASNYNLNDFRLYDHCLSPMEVKELAKGLVLHYPLNRGGWGQENIIPGTNLGTANWYWMMQAGNYTVAEETTLSGVRGCKFTRGTTAQSGWSVIYYNNINESLFKTSTAYKLSVDIYPSVNTSFVVSIRESNGTNVFANATPAKAVIANKWNHLEFDLTTVATLPSSTRETIYFQSMNSSTEVSYIFRNLKLEEGSIATPWCPNSSDTLATTMGLNSTTEYDCSGFCNNGTRTGTFSWTSDTPKYAVSQDCLGTNYTYLTPPSTEIQTIAVWVKWNTIPSGQSVILVDNGSGIGLGLYSGGILCSTSGAGSSYAFSKANLVANTWYHFVVVKTGTTTRKLYINGVEQTANSRSSNWSYSVNQLQLGKRSTTSDGFMGKLSDFRIYATALSADDVKSLYQNCATIDPDGTIRGQIRS